MKKIDGPQKMAENWITTLAMIATRPASDANSHTPNSQNETIHDLWKFFFTNDSAWWNSKLLVYTKIYGVYEGIC